MSGARRSPALGHDAGTGARTGPGGHRWSRSSGRSPSLLIITAAPDDRPSTRCLHDIVDELRRRDVRLAVWFVRAPVPTVPWEGTRVVESLRDWAPALFLDRAGAPRAAFRLRGLRRHLWLLAARPDVVIFDDGVGDNLVKRIHRPHVRIVRTNELQPFDVPPDVATPVVDVDLTLVGPGTEPLAGSRPLDAPLVRDWRAFFHDDPAVARVRSRRRLGLDDDATVVVGMGRDGWLDGPELFVRGLWTLQHRHGIEAHGVWLAPGADPNDLERLQEEADRCGLGGRITFLTDAGPEALLCGDVAFLPSRAAGDVFDALSLIGAGLVVVTFPVWTIEHSSLQAVPHLDLEAAADAIARALDGDPAERRTGASSQLETVSGWVDRLLDAIEACR